MQSTELEHCGSGGRSMVSSQIRLVSQESTCLWLIRGLTFFPSMLVSAPQMTLPAGDTRQKFPVPLPARKPRTAEEIQRGSKLLWMNMIRTHERERSAVSGNGNKLWHFGQMLSRYTHVHSCCWMTLILLLLFLLLFLIYTATFYYRKSTSCLVY